MVFVKLIQGVVETPERQPDFIFDGYELLVLLEAFFHVFGKGSVFQGAFHRFIVNGKRDVGADKIIGREHVLLLVVLVFRPADGQHGRFLLDLHDPAQGLLDDYLIFIHAAFSFPLYAFFAAFQPRGGAVSRTSDINADELSYLPICSAVPNTAISNINYITAPLMYRWGKSVRAARPPRRKPPLSAETRHLPRLCG